MIAHKNGTPQTVATASDATITWSVASLDQESCFEAVSNGYRTKYADTYLVRANISFDAANVSTANPYVFIRKNGVTQSTTRQSPASITDISTICCWALVECVVGDLIDVRFHHSNTMPPGATTNMTLRGDADLTNLHITRTS